jgi:hypothetical protein
VFNIKIYCRRRKEDPILSGSMARTESNKEEKYKKAKG